MNFKKKIIITLYVDDILIINYNKIWKYDVGHLVLLL